MKQPRIKSRLNEANLISKLTVFEKQFCWTSILDYFKSRMQASTIYPTVIVNIGSISCFNLTREGPKKVELHFGDKVSVSLGNGEWKF